MLKPPDFGAFFKQFRSALPADVLGIQEDLEKNLRAALNATFSHMHLVTREEFEIQAAVLARTRSKLEALEARVTQLEQGNPSVIDESPIAFG